jgi:DNA-binding NarL/FixJ family response regulator
LKIQLAVVDLVLPNASGLALIRKIQNAKSTQCRTLSVVVLTVRDLPVLHQLISLNPMRKARKVMAAQP